MPSERPELICPECREGNRWDAARCRACGADLDDFEDEPRRRRSERPADIQPTDFLVPTEVSGWAIASCYMGLVGFCLPLVGLVFAIPALICGIVAIRQRSRTGSYGAVTSNMRAIIGIVLSSLGILISAGLLVAMAVAK